MAIFDSSFGISFRQNQLILAYLKKSLGKIKLVEHAVHALSPESQKEEWESQTLGLINLFVSRHQIDKKKISICIPREKAIVRFIRFPAATKENLRKVLEYETPKYTPFQKGETYFDYHIFKEEKDWLHLFAVFVKKEEVDRYLSLLKKIGINPISIQIPSTAALNLFFLNGGSQEGSASVLLDVAVPFFELNLVQDRSLVESLHLPLPAESGETRILTSLKRTGAAGSSLPKSNFFIYGMGADEEFVTSLKEAGQLQTLVSTPLKKIQFAKGTAHLDRVYSSLGVPLKGLVRTELDVNLVPVEMRKKVRQFGKPVFIILSLVALVLGITWGAGALMRHRGELEAVNNEIKKRRPGVEAIERLQKKKEELGKDISELKKIETGEFSKVEILKELAQILPDSVWIWNMKYSGREIEISGFADSASDLLPLLDKSPLFEKVEFAAPVTKERIMRGAETREKERFKVKMKMEPRKS